MFYNVTSQDFQICDSKGRDCIESNIVNTFSCSKTCEGIYADVEWVGNDINVDMIDEDTQDAIQPQLEGGMDDDLQKRIAILEKRLDAMSDALRRMRTAMKTAVGEREEVDKDKYRLLISEYRKFKSLNVKHFRFNSDANNTKFCKLKYDQFTKNHN